MGINSLETGDIKEVQHGREIYQTSIDSDLMGYIGGCDKPPLSELKTTGDLIRPKGDYGQYES